MVTNSRCISVLIAGANERIGRELVSRFVSHPDVVRVVALTTAPIPVKRWTTTFPQLRIADALRCLSVVPVDWLRIMADARMVPFSYVKEGVWRMNDELLRPHRVLLSSLGQRRSTSMESTHLVRSCNDCGYVGSPKRQTQSLHCASKDPAISVDKSIPGLSSSGRARVSERVWRQEREAFLRQLLDNPFYRAIFTGHHVAVSCLHSTHILSSAKVLDQEYEVCLAFAKMVRLFTTIEHSYPSQEQESSLDDNVSQAMRNLLLSEIHAACYGTPLPLDHEPTFEHAIPSSSIPNRRRTNKMSLLSNPGEAAGATQEWGVTLSHYAQISVCGANVYNPFLYFRYQGRRDHRLLQMFNHDFHGGTRQHKFSSSRAGAERDEKFIGATKAKPWRWLISRLADSTPGAHMRAIALGRGAGFTMEKKTSDGLQSPERESWQEERHAYQRADLLQRHDVVKVWESADVTIWRPSLPARLRERLGRVISRCADHDDIIPAPDLTQMVVANAEKSFGRRHGVDAVGTAKVAYTATQKTRPTAGPRASQQPSLANGF